MPKKLSVPGIRVTSAEQQGLFAQAADPITPLKEIDMNGATLVELEDIVKAAHQSFQSHLGDALQAGLIAGKALLTAKQQFTYDRQTGGFRGWLERIEVSKSTAYRYIELATNEPIVSQAGTLSEAMERLAQHRAEQRALKAGEEQVEVKKRRVTLKLSNERDQKLESIAQSRGVDLSALIKEIVEQWLTNEQDN